MKKNGSRRTDYVRKELEESCVEKLDILFEYQFGFRKGIFTTQVMPEFKLRILKEKQLTTICIHVAYVYTSRKLLIRLTIAFFYKNSNHTE